MVDLTIEEGQRLKVLYGSCRGFHAADLDAMEVFDIYTPQHVRLVYISTRAVATAARTSRLYIYLHVPPSRHHFFGSPCTS